MRYSEIVNESPSTKTVTVEPSNTQLSKGAEALKATSMGWESGMERRRTAAKVYTSMVGNPASQPREVDEEEELPYDVQDQMRELRKALTQLWDIEQGRKYLPEIVRSQIPAVLANPSASRNQLADALTLLFKHSDQYDMPHGLKSSVRGQLIYLGKI